MTALTLVCWEWWRFSALWTSAGFVIDTKTLYNFMLSFVRKDCSGGRFKRQFCLSGLCYDRWQQVKLQALEDQDRAEQS